MASDAPPTTYTLEDVTTFRTVMQEIIEHLEAHPTNQGGAYEVNTNLREKGVTVIIKAKTKLPLLPPAGGTLCWENFVTGGLNPMLSFQLMCQLEDTMKELAELKRGSDATD